jgi:phage terminase large subunit-like protein
MVLAAPISEPFTVDHFRAWSAAMTLDNLEPFILDEFQELWAADLFAGYPECWLVVPEENGKTTLLADLALYHAEHRDRAAVPVAASSRDQAVILYQQGEGFVIRTPALHEERESAILKAKGKRKTTVPRFLCLEGFRRINHFRGGRIQVFAADDDTGDGVIPTLGIIDEPHRMKNMKLYRTWTGKLRKRGGQIALISTAGEPGTEFEVTRKRIRETATEVTRLPTGGMRYVSGNVVMHEYAVPEGADVEDMEVVKAANPSRRITPQTLATKFASPTMTLAHWKRFACNIATRGGKSAVTEAEWAAAKSESGIPKGQAIALGLDVAWKWDTTSAVPFWMKDPKDRLFGPATIITPPRDGNSLHPDEIKTALKAIHTVYPIHTVVMDISGAADIAAWIEDEIGAEVIDWPQSNTQYVENYDAFMEALRNDWLHHTGDPGLAQHVLNAIARMLPGGDVRFDRPVEGRLADQERRVIDALDAASFVNAFYALPAEEEAPTPFVLFGGGS